MPSPTCGKLTVEPALGLVMVRQQIEEPRCGISPDPSYRLLLRIDSGHPTSSSKDLSIRLETQVSPKRQDNLGWGEDARSQEMMVMKPELEG